VVLMIRGPKLWLPTPGKCFLLQHRAPGAARKRIPEGGWVALFPLQRLSRTLTI